MYKYLVLTVIISLANLWHPMHISVCEIEYDANRKALEITQRVFLDDLEKAIRMDRQSPELDIVIPGDSLTTDILAESYLKKHLKMTINRKPANWTYLGSEIENDAILCYMEIEKVKKLKSIEIFSDILHREFEDQANLIHIEVNDKVRSMKLLRGQARDVLMYD